MPGERISVMSIAKELGVSRMPVREAISQLERDGIVYQIPRFGAFFRTYTRDEIETMWELRKVIEVHVAVRAVGKITPDRLAVLNNLIEIIYEYAHSVKKGTCNEVISQRGYEADLQFHAGIWCASEDHRAVKMLHELRLILTGLYNATYKKDSDNSLRMIAGTWAIHKRMLLALSSGNVQEFKRLISEHIEFGKERSLWICDQINSSQKNIKSFEMGDGLGQMIELIDKHSESRSFTIR